MNLGIQGKVAVVTGADSGLGKATAKILASEGASVLLTDLAQEGLEKAAEEVRQQAADGAEVATKVADLTNDDEAKAVQWFLENKRPLHCRRAAGAS